MTFALKRFIFVILCTIATVVSCRLTPKFCCSLTNYEDVMTKQVYVCNARLHADDDAEHGVVTAHDTDHGAGVARAPAESALNRPRLTTQCKSGNKSKVSERIKTRNVGDEKLVKIVNNQNVKKNSRTNKSILNVKKNSRTDKNELLLWLKEVKNVWKEFPVEVANIHSDPVPFFGDCKVEESFGRKMPQSNTEIMVLNFNKNENNCFSKLGVVKINGTFVEGFLSGSSTVHFANGSFIRAPFSNGSLAGLARKFSCPYGSCDFDYEPWNVPNRLFEVSMVILNPLF